MRFAGRRPFITAPAWATRVERGHAYWSRLSLRRHRGLRRRNYRTRVDDRVGEQQVTVQTNVARNFPRSFFETARKRCNSNVLNSMFEILAGELRATLLGNHSDISTEEATGVGGTGGVGGMAAAPVGSGHAWPGWSQRHKRRRREGHRKACQRFDEPTAPKQKSHVISLGHFSRPPENVAIPTF